LTIEFQNVLPGRRNLIARLAPRKERRQSILLAPHMDTVGADPSKFVPRHKSGRLYGRGACDTKGSVAAMFSAVCEVARSKDRPAHTELIFAGLIDEENAQAGSRALARSGLKADLAIVGEPTQCRVVTAHKGCVWLQIEARGQAAHGATPQLGVNAIHRMAKIVERLEVDYARQLRTRRHKLLGAGSINVGTITGGKQPNIVPDACVIEIDRRYLPGETEKSVIQEIRALLARHHLTATFASSKTAPALPLETDAKLPLVRQFLHCAGQPRALGVDYFCDAAILAAGGIPSIVFGPGDIAQAHTVDEWISLSQLERAKDLLVKFFRAQP
ncbi:MAG TPA: M20/M25/M40 family metallo-hydrolase, partial [Verrucomicrobiae bacterium]